MIGPIITGLVFSALVIVLSFFRPETGRIFLGFFMIVMGLGVNLFFVITQPFFVFEYGMGAWLPLFRNLTEAIIGMNPKLFGVFLIIFEVFTGLFILAKGLWVKVGLIGLSLFILMLIPLYYSQIAWAVSIIGIQHLLRTQFDQSVIDLIRAKINS